MSFIKKLQSTAKVRAIRKKIRSNEAIRKRLSGEYRRTLKSEGSRLGKQIKKSKKSKKAKSKRRR